MALSYSSFTMTTQDKPWHDEDDWWTRRAAFMFSPQRWQSAKEEIDKIIAMLELPDGASVLDLCCGPGRHSLELARRGFRVTAVDRTRAYLDEARKRARDEGLSIDFVEDDMRQFCRADAFDGAINMFTSFGYFANAEDDRQVCCNLHESLRDGSRLLLDIMGKEILARVFQQRDWAEAEDILLMSERTVHDNWSWIKVREIYIDGGIRYDGGFEHRLYSASELSSLARTAGFSRIQIFGGLDGSPYDQNAKRLVLIAQK